MLTPVSVGILRAALIRDGVWMVDTKGLATDFFHKSCCSVARIREFYFTPTEVAPAAGDDGEDMGEDSLFDLIEGDLDGDIPSALTQDTLFPPEVDSLISPAD